MRRFLLALALLAGTAVVTDAVLDACGSKFLVGARTARYQRLQAAVNPATILFYYQVDPNDPESEGGWDDVTAVLSKVGHSIEPTTDENELKRALSSGKFDVVMMTIDDARDRRAEVQTLAPDTILLPMMEFPTRPQYSRAKREFGQVLQTPSTLARLLSTIEKAQEDRGL